MKVDITIFDSMIVDSVIRPHEHCRSSSGRSFEVQARESEKQREREGESAKVH